MNEANELRLQNEALMEENTRSRAFIEKLLRHPAFHPFLDDLSREPAIVESISHNAPSSARDEQGLNFNSLASPQGQNTPRDENASKGRGEVTVPLRGNPWPVPDMDISTYESPRVYSVLELPQLRSLPFGENNLCEKDDIFSSPSNFESAKQEFPSIDAPRIDLSEKHDNLIDRNNDDYSCDLYDDNGLATSDLNHYRLPPFRLNDCSDCATSPNNLHPADGNSEEHNLSRFKQICMRMDPVYERVKSMTAHLDM